ncbi:class I SAM-dependent methyltransferase [Candidatus Micrarchaeota archaeon]|nr:class I SAM-dependent methyltransferase [Candidatus Micrarchaeota archaeon]
MQERELRKEQIYKEPTGPPVPVKEFLSRLEREKEKERREAPGFDLGFSYDTSLKKLSENLGVDICGVIRRKLENAKKPVRVADFGCFDGRALKELSEKFRKEVDDGRLELHGVSLNEHPSWKDYSEIHWHEAPLETSELPENHFDFGFSWMALHHIEWKDVGIKEFRHASGYHTRRSDLAYMGIANAMKPGGLVALMSMRLATLGDDRITGTFDLRRVERKHPLVFVGVKLSRLDKNIM